MRSKRQARQAKIAAKKAAVSESKTAEIKEVDKTRKTSVSKSESENVKIEKKSKRNEKKDESMQPKEEKSAGSVRKRKIAAVKPNVQSPYGEEITLPDKETCKRSVKRMFSSPELQPVIDAIFASENFQLLPIDVEATVMDIDRVRYSFQRDSETGRSRYDPNGRDMNGKTPLHYAIKFKQKDAIQVLLDNGADCSAVDYYGDNALMAAVKTGEASAMNLVWRHRGGLDINYRNADGMTALHLAAERSWEGCVQFLLSNRACPDIKNISGLTPLVFSCVNGDQRIAEMLIKAGADVYREDSSFYKAVLSSVSSDNEELLDYLLKEIDDDNRRGRFVKEMMENISNPPYPEMGYSNFEMDYFPVFNACFEIPEYRNSFYNENVVNKIAAKMEDYQQDIDAVTTFACVIVGVFFRFGNEIDKPFVKHFMKCKGPELVIHMVQFFTSEWGYEKKQTVFIFLPVIGLAELQEGRTWIFDHAIAVSEFFAGFEKDGLHKLLVSNHLYKWCYEGKYFTEINRVWIHFYNVVSNAKAEKREIQLAALLEQEARQISKLAKPKERNSLELPKAGLENNITEDFSETSSPGQSLCLDSGTSAVEELGYLYSDQNACTNSNAFVGTPDKGNSDNHNNDIANQYEAQDYFLDGTCVDEEWLNEVFQAENAWTTVHTKKHKDKDKEKKVDKQSAPVQTKFIHARRDRTTQREKQKPKKEVKKRTVPLNTFNKPLPGSTPLPGTARWADVAKGTDKRPGVNSAEANFPKPNSESPQRPETESPKRKFSMETTPKDRKERPSKMVFHFHENAPEEFDIDSNADLVGEETDVEEVEVEIRNMQSISSNEVKPQRGYDQCLSERKETSAVPLSPSGECFMYDPEYVDEERKTKFDPTKLTDEEIKSMNFKVKSDNLETDGEFITSQTDSEPSHSNFRCHKNDENWLETVRFDDICQEETSKETCKGHCVNLFGTNLWFRHDTEEYHNVPQQRTQASKTNGKKMHNKQRSVRKASTSAASLQSSKAEVSVAKESKSRKKTVAVVSATDAVESRSEQTDCSSQSTESISSQNADCLTGEVKATSQVPTDTAKVQESSMFVPLTSAEADIYRNQVCTFADFEACLERHENDPFMEYVPSQPSPVLEQPISLIDSLFSAAEEIPEWFEDEESNSEDEGYWKETEKINDENADIEKSLKDYLREMRESQETDFVDEATLKYQELPETDDEKSQTGESKPPVTAQALSPVDLEIADPAIISCSKGPSYVSNTSVNIACKMMQEYDAEKRSKETDKHTSVQGKVRISKKNGNKVSNRTNTQSDDVSLSHTEIQTALGEPLRFLKGSSLPATNCEFGQKLLENACKLEDTEVYQSDDEVWSPGELNGEPLEPEEPAQEDSVDEEFFFPSFHGDTKLSGHHNEQDISIAHRVQQIQHQQLEDFYSRCRDKIIDYRTMDNARFIQYAQAAGMTKEQIQQYLEGKVEPKRRERPAKRDNQEPLPGSNVSAPQSDQPTSPGPYPNQGVPQGKPQYAQPTPMYPCSPQYGTPNPGYPTGVPLQPGRMPAPYPYCLMYGFVRPLCPPASHPANIRNIQSQQAAMSNAVKAQIQEMMLSMFSAKIRSVRWREHLARIRALSPEKLMVVNKIVVPREESDRVYIVYHSTGVTMLGYMVDGTEVAVKMMNSTVRPISPEERERLLCMDSSQMFLARYRAIEENDGLYYLATDLHEYTLPEYLHVLRKNSVDVNTAKAKLVFQLLRGFALLHQQYLIVHAELRPDNVVIDTEGNVKVTGYGLGRNIERNQFVEYNDEDKCWLAPEVLMHRQNVSFKQDIWVVGMMIYYILSGGKNPFGSETREIIHNIVKQNYVMDYVSEEAAHLLSQMLSVNKIDRPAISDALKHPLFWSDEKKLRFVMIVGSDIVWEMKNVPTAEAKQREDSMMNILSLVPCNINLIKWLHTIEPVILREMRSFRQYKNNFVDLVIFAFNCCTHFETLSAKVREAIDEPCRYFLSKFPTLFMTVYRAIRASNRKDKPCYKPFF